MLQTLFPRERSVFQDDNTPVHTSRCVQTWLHEHDDEVEYLTWCLNSPDLNIIEPLWGYLENKVRAWFPPPSTLFELETVLHEEWLQILMNILFKTFIFQSHVECKQSLRPKVAQHLAN
ncbi:DDE_3 domain-containing protein [Trichonephila clavipes]|nr:DDE_3 domain-containing protein [Trichonephila clavipes]